MGLLASLLGASFAALPVVGQSEVPTAMPPVALSARLLAQGHPVTREEALYLDADEQVTEEFVRLLVGVRELAATPPTAVGWWTGLLLYLQRFETLDPALSPVPPPDSLLAVHAHAVSYRENLARAARAWNTAVEDDDPYWLSRGMDAYGAAERERLAWHKALWERYVGTPAPGP